MEIHNKLLLEAPHEELSAQSSSQGGRENDDVVEPARRMLAELASFDFALLSNPTAMKTSFTCLQNLFLGGRAVRD